MKKTAHILTLVLIIALLFACSKTEEKLVITTLYAGPDTTEPAMKEPTYIVHLLMEGNVGKDKVESAGIEIMKQHLEKAPDLKRVKLLIHADSTNFVHRRAEVRIGYFGTGEPQVEINRWKSNN